MNTLFKLVDNDLRYTRASSPLPNKELSLVAPRRVHCTVQ